MAKAKDVKVKVKVDDDGSLKKVADETKKASKETDKLGKSTDKAGKDRNRFHKGEKGVAGATSNSTKAFAKQAQTINGGSSSLVGAYATLAANVFALSAAFNFFKRAADVANLQKSQLQYAATTGTALSSMTQKLRDASGGMLGFQEAAQASAIGVAKGFSPAQMEKIAEGARKASTALGRDFGDAFDRLVRGVSKAEPELLDELGITLRLETATKNYAAAIGSSADKLTAAQRSQAVYAETLRQIEENFGQVIPKDNPFVLLQKTFEDVVRAGTQFILPFFEGFANIVSGNGMAAVAVFGALGVSIFKLMVPLDGIKSRFADMTSAAIADIQKLDDEIAEIDATLLDKAGAKAGVKTAAQDAGGATSKSKLMQKAAAGKLDDPKQIGQLQSALKKRIKEGDKYTGVLKEQSVEQAQAVLKSLNTQVKHTKKATDKKIRFHTKMFKKFEKQTAKAKKAYLGFTEKAGKASAFLGKQMGRMMKFAGFVGVIIMLIETFKKLRLSIGDIAVKTVEVVQKAIGIVFKAVNKVIDGINFMVRTIAKVYGSIIGFILTGFVKFVNKLIEGYNKAAGFFGKEQKALLDASKFANMGQAAADAAPQIGRLNEEFKFSEDGFVNNMVKKAVAIQEAGESAEHARKLMEGFNKTQKTMGKDLENIQSGLGKHEKGPLKGQQKVTDPLQRSKMRISGVQTLGVGGEVAKISGALKNNAISQEQASKSIENLRKEMVGIGEISPLVSQVLYDNSLTVAEMAEKLKALDEAAGSFKSNFADMEKGITNFPQALGSLTEMETALTAIVKSAQAAQASANKLGETDSAQAAQEKSKASAELLGKVKAIRLEREALAVTEAQIGLLTGAVLQRRQASLALAKAENVEADKRLVYEQRLKELGADHEDTIKAKGELDVASAAVGQATVKDVTAKFGADMGAAEASSQILGTMGGAAEYDKDGKLKEGTGAIKLESFSQAADYMSPAMEQLKKLGPEGELMAAATEGLMGLGETMQEAFKGGSMSMQDGLNIAAQAFSTLNGIYQKQAKAKIAGIDKEIAAEKKRDGKSKESIAKIKQLEKKKETIEKKAFEKDKKAKKAGVIISTAQAVAKAIASSPLTFGLPWSAFALATGMMQLSAISQSTYEGGGSSVAGAAEKGDVSVGQRSNAVDLASSRSAVGELGYSRGAMGVGGMGNFKPAFTGARYRAVGGSAGFVVGEQGPELCMPDTPGTIVPADDTAAAGGGSTNLNFTINAMDSQDVERTLSGQTGNIIRMIRETANDAGETFLEGLDERY